MHLLKMSKMEIANNPLICVFIMLQSVIILVALIFGTSVFTSRYEKYKAIHDIVGDDGIVMNAQILEVAGENPENYSCTEKEHMEELFPNTTPGCTYDTWISYNYKNVFTDYFPRTISYENEVAFAYTPEMKAGRWFEEEDNTSVVIEAVITNNTFGITVGDVLTVDKTYLGEVLEEELKVKIIGIIDDGTNFIANSLINYTTQNDVRDCFTTYSMDIYADPFIFILQDDLRSTEKEVLGEPHFTTMTIGLQFLRFDEEITEEEKEYIYDVIKSDKCSLVSSTRMPEFIENSKEYIWNQLNELIPVFIGILFLVFVSLICISAIIARAQLRNYAIYYLVGLKWKDCIRIQIIQQILLQFTAFVIAVTGILITEWKGVLDNTVVKLGVYEVGICIIYILVCVVISAILPYKIIRENTPKSILASKE